jgi:hypothetical protein
VIAALPSCSKFEGAVRLELGMVFMDAQIKYVWWFLFAWSQFVLRHKLSSHLSCSMTVEEWK